MILRITKYSLYFIAFILCFGCNDEMPDIQNNPNDVDPVVPDGTEAYLTGDSDYIFNQDSLYSYYLILPESNLNFIDNDPAAEIYVEGKLLFQGDTISPVGIRYKGSIGAYVGCLSGNDWADPSGFKTCTKLSMKVKINWDQSQDKFYGLKKLQFHSMNNDPSQLRERLGYHLFKSIGVETPRAVHAKLYINGDYNGLFALIEQIDGRFAKENFDDDDGNVYKEIWPHNDDGEVQSDEYYLSGLKTNEDQNPSVGIMKSFAQDLASANGEAERKEILENYLDVQKTLSYAVVDRLIRHDDGPFHWYCELFGSCTNHNYYWYEEPNENRLNLIPWDLDNAFENIIEASNPVTPIADDWGEISNNCNPFFHGPFGLRQWSASCDLLTGTLSNYVDEYASTKTQFIETDFSKEKVDQLIADWRDQIRDATEEASIAHGDAISPEQWISKTEELKLQCDFARIN